MALYLYIALFLFANQAANGLVRRRIPVTVYLPQYIRMSSDPHTTQAEKMIAKSKGVNVCVKRQEMPKSRFEQLCKSNQCERVNAAGSRMQKQKRVYYTKYECCLGFKRVKHQKGCPHDTFGSIYNIIQVANRLGLSKFVYLAKKSMLHHTLARIGPITVFIPSNHALDRYLKTTSGKKTFRNKSALRIFLIMHVFGGRWPKVLIENRRRLENFLTGHSREMNVKIYEKSMIIQNALIIKNDQPASNGIVHVINDILSQSYGNIQYILGHHKKLKIFNEGLKMLNYKMEGFNTIFAPTDEAFRRFNIKTSNDLVQSFKCIKEFILTHIVHGLFFTTIINKGGQFFLRNHLDDILPILKFNNKTYIKNLLVEMKYFAATDGSVYTIDRLLVSSKALSIQRILKKINSMSLVEEMITRTNLEKRYFPINQSVTLFLPSNRAIKYMRQSTIGNLKKTDNAIEFLLNHIVLGKYPSHKLKTNMVLNSLTNHSIRISKRSEIKICIQGSRMSYRLKDIYACNAVIHVITLHPIRHSKHTILDILKNDSRFSILTMALKITDLSEYVNKESPITFFAPTNEAWSKLDNKTLTNLFEDNNKLNYIIKYHLIASAIYSCDIKAGRMSPYSLTGTRVRISFKNSYSNTILYNYAETIEDDITAKNGVLYAINSVVRYLYKRKYIG